MTGEAPPPRRGRWIAAVATLLALGSLVVGISIGNDGNSGGSRRAAGVGPNATDSSDAPPSDTQQSGSRPTDTSSPDASPSGQPGSAALPVGLKLSAGQAQQPVAPVPVVDGQPLGADRIAAIIHRLPPFKSDDRLTESFRWPAQTTPAPAAGKKVPIVFPDQGRDNPAAPGTPAPSPTGPLTVLRMQPMGAVTIAPFISITFNQPMVAVTTIGQLASTKVPVTISPQLRGSWQWIGTSTVRFVADSTDVDRLPMATKYTVTVPAGTKSASGSTLGRTAIFSFSTPPPSVKHFEPTGKSMKLDPIFVAVFDQKVSQRSVLEKVTVTAGGRSQPFRLATGAELAADAGAAKTASVVPAGRVVAFRPVHDLPTDQPITVTFGAGMPSAEGPERSAAATTFTGHTYSALSLGNTDCGGGACQPSSPIVLAFNNALDGKAFDPTAIKISPEIPGGASVSASDHTIYITGDTQGDTTYTVTVPAGLTDTFGQKLGAVKQVAVRIGKAAPRLDPFPNAITTLDPMVDTPTLSVNTVNRKQFRERVFAVSPSDWAAYQRYYVKLMQGEPGSAAGPAVPGWPVLVDRDVTINGAPDRLVSTHLDLSTALNRTGHVVVLIDPTKAETFGDGDWQNRTTVTWAQATTIGLDALNDSTQLRTWATDLRDGSPLTGVTVSLISSTGATLAATATTDANGIASMDLTSGGAGALLATKGSQTALLPSAMWNNSWATTATKDSLLWYVNDDRQTYRPGEVVSVKGWVRRQSSAVAGGLSLVPQGSKVSYIVHDAYGIDIGHGTTDVSRLGGFNLTVRIPGGANLGGASIDFTLTRLSGVANDPFGHPFQIADFRTPDFEVGVHGESPAPYVVGDDLTVAADASYYAGGPLGDSRVDWQVRTAPARYAPAGWDTFTFGIWTPWWQLDDSGFGKSSFSGRSLPSGPYSDCCQPPDPTTDKVEKFSGSTDGQGGNYLKVKVGNLGAASAGLPVTVTAQATVTDVNRQAIAGTDNLLVHPADYYVGLASPDTFVTQGKDLAVQAIATNIDGAATAGLKIDIRTSRVTTTFTNGAAVDTESDTRRCQVTSTTRPVNCRFTPPAAGTYRITATVTDNKGRTSRSQLTRWVAGPAGAIDASVQRQQLTLVPDKKDYQPGQTAKLLVQSPIRSGSGLMTVLHNGISSTSRFSVQGGAAVVELPMTEADIPGVTASIEVVGTVPRSTADSGGTARPRPAYATGGIDLTVSALARTLKVTATPRQRIVAPGASTQLDVTVKDQHGKPVAGSEFEVVVADEAVLALGGQQLPDPLQAFYPQSGNQLTTFYGRSVIALTDQLPLSPSQGEAGSSSAASSAAGAPTASAMSSAPQRAASGAASDSASIGTGKSASGPPIADRTNFDALALFVPSAITDARGQASIKVPLPDSLTRYRVMVVAVAGAAQFGIAESTITAALPVTVRPSGPQFLNFGDALQLPVLVQNQTEAALTTDVVIQAANLKLTGPAGRQVTVPARGRVEVDFAVSAVQAGTAKFRVAAVAGNSADAATIELPVYTPATTESFASYGTVRGGETVRQPLSAPKGVVDAFGGLHISTSSTALQQLTDAVGYLANYDYDSSDGLAAQIIAIGSVGDVLQVFSAPGLPSAASLKSLVAVDVGKLLALQNDDGGFPYWRRGDTSDPFNSIQAQQALLVAEKYGSAVPPDRLGQAMQYLADINSHIPRTASPATRDNLRAYALRVRMQGGQRDSAGAQALVANRGQALPLDAVAWLLPVVTDAGTRATLLQILNNAAVDDAGSVSFTNAVTDDAWTTLQSDRRTDGLILDALISVKPDSDLIGKIVSGLMAAQRGGRWDNVQENAFILLALRHYYDAFESATPDFVAGIWLGNRFAGQHAFSGHTTERAVVSIPTRELVKDGTTDITLRNAGTGTLFYRLALQSAPSDFKLVPLDRGFVVSRTYTAVDKPGDVTRDSGGTWHIKAGARVRVTLGLVSRSAHTHVALIDPLPAGLQILNPDLATTPKDLGPTAPQLAGAMDWYSTWFDHQNLRDDRAEAFASQLQGGVYDYHYLVRATTAGTFVAPPTRAEMVYAPETFGRTGTDKVVIGG
ncbi:MAG: hypothetical protein M3Z00_07540 [Actinomycetota bacterium]|nr:hypothetical protein [Actinomycetota bacterium]